MVRTPRTLCLAALVAALAALAAAPASAQTRYSLVHGCYALKSAGGAALKTGAHVRMQATTLGRYLIYRPDGTFVAAQGDGSVAPDKAPSPAADWRLTPAGGGAFRLSPQSAKTKALAVQGDGSGRLASTGSIRFTKTAGCATFPEAPLDARGRPARASTSFGRVGGLVEGHMHWMTFEYIGGNFHCGRPWHPYGIRYALPDCSSVEGPEGEAAPFQNFLNYGNPAQPHDTSGYPDLTEWSNSNLTYEGTYWRWVERAWLGGLRLMVMGINENRILCMTQENRKTNCNEMDTVRRGLKDMRELQRYVDAQAGGPGKGFFQIVTNPYDARRVINRGQMAVVLEIEVSEPFDCHGWEQSSCDQKQVDRQLNEVYKDGVRSMLLLNKFDNPLTGVRFDDGPVGVLINGANKLSSGSYWNARHCTGKLHDNTIYQPSPALGVKLNALATALGLGASAPAYPPAPHCNTRGLTDLGRHVIRRMMDKHMIVNPDHMSQASVGETLSLLEARHYSGVISPHGWMDPGNWPRIWKLGGVAWPGHSVAQDYVSDWHKYRPRKTPFAFGWGYGADLGGLSHQPVASSDGGSFKYPFKSYDGKVTFTRQKTGNRRFDYGKEGVAHYGLYADWFHDLERIGGHQLASDMWHGSEAYLEMWERADGVRTPRCSDSDESIERFQRKRFRLGSGWVALLRRAGQPQQRTRTWSWCVLGRHNRHRADVAVLSKSGHVQLAGSTANGRSAGGVPVGAKARKLRGTRAAGGGVRFRVKGGRVKAYALRGGRVRAVAVARRSLARNHRALRAAMRRVVAAKASSAKRVFVPSAAQASGAAATNGKPLAGTSDARLNAALIRYCMLQMGGTGVSTPPGAAAR
jgi:hypothetical protein